MKRKMWLLSILGLVMMLLVACGGGGGDQGSSNNEGGNGGASGNAITITASDFKYEPAQFTFQQGQTYEITFVNDGPSTHDITIDDLGMNSGVINPGDSVTFEFTPEQAGSFEAYCTVPGHKDLGMVANVTVQ